MNELRNTAIKKEIPKNENSDKIIIIIEKIVDFNRQQKGKVLKILTPKQMFQRLPITLAQVKAVNTSENLINEVKKIMDAIFMNSKNSKTSDPHRLLFNFQAK